jgi:hypothetical protein
MEHVPHGFSRVRSGHCKKNMNLSSSVLEPDKLLIHDGYPPQGLSEARRTTSFLSLIFPLPNRRGGVSSGAAAIIIPGGGVVTIFGSEYYVLHGKSPSADKKQEIILHPIIPSRHHMPQVCFGWAPGGAPSPNTLLPAPVSDPGARSPVKRPFIPFSWR